MTLIRETVFRCTLIAFSVWLLFLCVALVSGSTKLVSSNAIYAKQVAVHNVSGENAFENAVAPIKSVWTIAINNTMVVVVNFVGLATFGLFSLVVLAANGFVLGLYLKSAFFLDVPLLKILQLTTPHFLEYIAVWVAGGIGFQGFILGKNFILSKEIPSMRYFLSLLFLMVTCVLLIFIAAFIEYYFSIQVMGK